MLSANQLRRIANTSKMPKFAEAFAEAAAKHMPTYGIREPKDVAAAWATFAVETGGFRIIEENMKYTAKRMMQVWPSRFKTLSSAKPYAGNPQKLANKVYGQRASLGNKGRPNAGWLYRGSGPIQTTGYVNYKLSEDMTGMPLTSDPDILRRDPDAGMQAACIFWQHKNISEPANKGDIRRVRKIVNGGYIGFDKFEKYYKRALAIVEKEGFGFKTTQEEIVDAAIEGSRAGAAKLGVTVKQSVKVKIDQEPEPIKNPKSKILPLYRPQQSPRLTKAILDKFEHLTPASERDKPVKVLFVRGYFLNSMGRKGANDRALYDDAVFVVSPEGVQAFNGNSDPSVYRKRIATIKADQAIRYKPGLHGYNRKNGPYPAFRQDAACTVVRDKVGLDTGMFHVNVHRGGVNGTSSLGCLTIPPHQWDEFRNLINGLLDKHSQPRFYVTLLEYPGDNPPVKLPAQSGPVAKKPAMGKQTAGGALIGAGVVAVATWWESIANFFQNLF